MSEAALHDRDFVLWPDEARPEVDLRAPFVCV